MTAVPLAYPKIPGSKHCPSGRCVAFEKVDGTNLHWDWVRDFGWITFGTRRDEFDLDDRGVAEFHAAHPGQDDAPRLFLRSLATALEGIFRDNPAYRDSSRLTAFTEYAGPHSFAGTHRPGDAMGLVLFDVRTDVGFVGPEQFVSDFGGLRIPRVVYRGQLTGKFAEDVRVGKYGVAEGVVCKGGQGVGLWMVKIKTYAYQKKLQESFKERWKDYWE